jgi:hypothetical protein
MHHNILDHSDVIREGFTLDINKEFAEASNYSEKEIKSMSETMRILNLRYFAGTENLNSKDVVDSEGFKLWLNSPESFLKSYGK